MQCQCRSRNFANQDNEDLKKARATRTGNDGPETFFRSLDFGQCLRLSWPHCRKRGLDLTNELKQIVGGVPRIFKVNPRAG